MSIGVAMLREMLDALEADSELAGRLRRALGRPESPAPSESTWVRVQTCGVPVTSVRRAIKAGELTASRIGRDQVVRRAELDAWIEAHRIAVKPANDGATAPGDDDALERLVRDGRLIPLEGGKR